MTLKIISTLVGSALAYGLGALWYMVLSKPWMKAAKITEEEVAGTSSLPYLMALLVWVVTSAILNFRIYPGLVEGSTFISVFRVTVGLWLCFGLLSTVLSTYFGNRGRNLIWIDGGYTLIGGLVIGAAHYLIAA